MSPSDQPFLLGIDVLEEGARQEWLAAIRTYLQVQHRSRLQRQAEQLERTGQQLSPPKIPMLLGAAHTMSRGSQAHQGRSADTGTSRARARR